MESADPAPKARRSLGYFNKLKHPSRFSKPQLGVFILAFAVIGYLLVRVFAAPPLIASLEAENMTPNLPTVTQSTGFVTTVTNNMTLKTPYVWAFNPPTATVAGYFFADGKMLAKVTGPGPYAFRLNPGVLTSGAHTLGHSWDTTDGIHQAPPAGYPVTISNTSSGGFVTTVTKGATLNTPFLWAFDPGTATKAGYFFADGKKLNTINAAGPYAWVMPVSTLSSGAHTLGHSWDTTTGVHQAPPSGYPVTINNTSSSAPGTASTIVDTTASAGKAEKFSAGVSISGSVTLPSAGSSLSVIAHGEQCSTGGWPTMTVSLDGAQVLSTTVSSSSWTSYSITKSMTAGSHTLLITNASSGTCTPNLYADVTNFFGIVAPPTVTLTPNPASITAGSSSTLSWNSTNATSCSANWTSSTATSGTQSVSPAVTTNYTVTCTGDGGSTSASATVTVTSASAGFTTSLTNGMTITPPYTWTFNPGVPSVKGYFFADGTLLATATPDANGAYTYVIPTGKLTDGAHTLGHSWDTTGGVHQAPPAGYNVTISSGTTTPPPPPPPTGTVYFDGRAKNMTSISSTGIAQNNNIVQSQSPKTWDCLCYTNNDIQLASDSRYSKIYSIRAGYGSHNPYNTGADLNNAASAELSHVQPMTIGRWDWYSNAYYVKTPFTQTPWMVFFQYGYPTLSSPPVSFNADDLGTGTPTWDIQMNSGLLTKTSTGFYRGANADRYTLQPIQFNSWVEVIVGVKWETNNTGELHVYMRNPSLTSTWTQVANKTGIATEQYGTTGYGTCSADYHDCPTITDHGGIYFGYWDDSTPIPTNYDNQMGMSDSSDLTTAQSLFP